MEKFVNGSWFLIKGFWSVGKYATGENGIYFKKYIQLSLQEQK